MDTSTVVNIILCILSFILAAVSVITVVITIKQNSKMIEASTRPYIGIYNASFHVRNVSSYFIIIKNFGQSSAFIEEFSSDINLSEISLQPSQQIPFNGLQGTEIMPGQSFKTAIDYNKAVSLSDTIQFKIKYSSSSKEYCETMILKLTSNSGNLVPHSQSECNELTEISATLQEMHIRSL